ncbi:Glycine betaine/carnitine/choline transport ATP-binding protein OpuCA [Roseivivax jejudonensis]|uniref:Glycine betaine/carnitine/choline transport ATP-binding protein OpuCA n=1 Tax=Roseivivax jejudonensis TaxID=1529041 RepID=A0A1X6Z0W6_9RHOB|nr:DUF294 nucleotidyltransferase-like domain-containing protein [Roseivivax jejudonensis]SLN37578.1 Glycine betaine/carnitine/choline transport ATP-binding protein OpuCA [Roseivivax jejudonensis]
MALDPDALVDFLSAMDPYAALTPEARRALAHRFRQQDVAAGHPVYTFGDRLDGLYIVVTGEIEVRDEHGAQISLLGPRNSFGERGLGRDGLAATTATARSDATLLVLPAAEYHDLVAAHDHVRRFFDRRRQARPEGNDLATSRVETLMARSPLTCPPDATAQDAARRMRAAGVSSICVTEGDRLAGIVTLRDVSGKIVAEGRSLDTPLSDIMTRDPVTLEPSALGSDVLHAMMEHGIGHLPICVAGRLVGIVTQTDLTRYQAVTSADLVGEVATADTAEEMARVTARIPQLLSQLVAAGNRHEVTTRLVTDIADAATRRLLALAEAEFGPPPVPYLWLACGSQGRQEQTGVSDQDNCLILDDAATETDFGYFDRLARFVSDGLHTCGYVYCPGDMMATNPRWRQPLRVWRDYFRTWISRPDPEAQMLASVMFDLRAIGGTRSLFDDLREETLAKAQKNSIFVSHMIANSLKHTPPLGLIRGFALIRSGEHKNTLDLKHSGVVPVTDLGRVYALQGRLLPVNTRARLAAARSAGVISERGGQDLLDAYDHIAETRLNHQARQVRRGEAPDNFLAPAELSDFDRAHLRDAFVVVKGMQSSVGHGRGMLS